MAKLSIISSLFVGASALVATAAASPITVQSVLFDHDGDVVTVGPPAIDMAGNPIQNGAFLIYRIPDAADPSVGDGVDDRTKGIFDFRGDADYGSFGALFGGGGGRVTAATLQFVLTVANPMYVNDQFNLENGPFVGEPEVGNQLTNNPYIDANRSLAQIITLNLLDYYSSEQLVNFVSNGSGDFVNDGRVVFTYSDDAVVSGAMLRLTAIIPEPSALSLAALALVATGAATRRRRPTGAG